MRASLGTHSECLLGDSRLKNYLRRCADWLLRRARKEVISFQKKI
jgi:hypothetical protein